MLPYTIRIKMLTRWIWCSIILKVCQSKWPHSCVVQLSLKPVSANSRTTISLYSITYTPALDQSYVSKNAPDINYPSIKIQFVDFFLQGKQIGFCHGTKCLFVLVQIHHLQIVWIILEGILKLWETTQLSEGKITFLPTSFDPCCRAFERLSWLFDWTH